MDRSEGHVRSREAHRGRRAQRQRVAELRARAVAATLLAFALLWAVVFVQMATGNDPVLGPSTPPAAGRERALPAEAGEATQPEEVQSDPVDPEPIEAEPEPVITGQS
jgi:hypothetical protein